MFPTCVIFMREVASLSVMFPTGVPLRDDGASLNLDNPLFEGRLKSPQIIVVALVEIIQSDSKIFRN